jgi:regulator of sigma D
MAESINERRQNTSKIVRELLDERRQVWSLYCAIGEMQPFAADQPLESRLQEFCQLLIDYTSLGHFGIYQRIVDGTERRRKVLEVAEQIYDRIAETTNAAVEFNDKYEELAGDELRAQLAEDLSRLGEELAIRSDLEDQLVKAMVS